MQLFVTHLDRSRFAPAVWSPTDGERGEQLRSLGIPVFAGADLQHAAETYRPDIIHIHRAGWPQPELLRPLRPARRLCADGRVLPRIVETNVFGRHDPSASGRLIDATLFVSHFCARRFAQVHGIRTVPPRYHVLYNPVDTTRIGTLGPTPAQRDYTRPVIGRLSRPDPGKWSPLALSFLPRLARELPDFRYRIIGGIPEAEAYVRSHNLGQHVTFLPPVQDDSELAQFFASLSVLAHANDTGESFGLAIAEAMAAGLPVVTHPCPDLRDNAQLELVDHNVTGLVAHTADDYAEALLYLLRNPHEAQRMGEAAQRKAQATYEVALITRQLEQIYDSLLTVPTTTPPADTFAPQGAAVS